MQKEIETRKTEAGRGKGIPYLYLRSADNDRTASNIGELLRDGEHDRLLTACRWRTKSDRTEVPLSTLSDYEYFRLYADCFLRTEAVNETEPFPEPDTVSGADTFFASGATLRTETEQTDRAFLEGLLGHPIPPCNDNSDYQALWETCNRALTERQFSKADDTATNHTDVYCYFADYTLWDEAVAAKRWGNIPPPPGKSLTIIPGRMPAVFRRPDPHHATLAYRKLITGTATPEETDLLYAQILRTAARFCAKEKIPLYLGSVSPDLSSFLGYIREQAGDIRVLAAVNEVSFRYLPDDGSLLCRPAVSDAETAVRISSFYPLRELIRFPKIGCPSWANSASFSSAKLTDPNFSAASANFFPEYAVAAQDCFRKTLAEHFRSAKKTHGVEELLRAVCYENFISFLNR